jgi:hypothetical protein
MQASLRRTMFHILVFVVALVVLSLPIWLGLGPVVYSEGLAAGIAN